MHRGHEHFDHEHGPSGHGHNSKSPALQWQTPHLPAEHHDEPKASPREPDLDLVEDAFVESFARTSDPTSFLRLAQIKFEGVDEDGARLALLRVEVEQVADVGSLTPRLQGGFVYDPLPVRLVSRRQRLRFIYFDGRGQRILNLAAATMLTDVSDRGAISSP